MSDLWFKDFDFTQCVLKDKPLQQMSYLRYMLARTQQMFRYTNLPDSIPQRELELQLQMFGHVGFFHYDGQLFALHGGFAGKPGVYYIPEDYIISNPALKLSKQFRIDDDLVVVKNDSMYSGLMPMFMRYSTQLVENDLSMMLSIINTRIINLLIAGDDTAMKSAKKYIDDIVKGEFGIIGDNKILEAIRTQPYAVESAQNITQLIEAQQYLKAGWFNELGLDANYNMKRESLTSEEVSMNHDALFPFIDDMLHCRKEDIEKVNQMFGTDIQVEFNSVWEVKQDELDTALDDPDEEAAEPVEIQDESGESGESYFREDEPEAADDTVEVFEEVVEAIEEVIQDEQEGDEAEDESQSEVS